MYQILTQVSQLFIHDFFCLKVIRSWLNMPTGGHDHLICMCVHAIALITEDRSCETTTYFTQVHTIVLIQHVSQLHISLKYMILWYVYRRHGTSVVSDKWWARLFTSIQGKETRFSGMYRDNRLMGKNTLMSAVCSWLIQRNIKSIQFKTSHVFKMIVIQDMSKYQT